MRVMVLMALIGLTSCAGIVEGTSQKITVKTVPDGATCRLDRAGQQLGSIAAATFGNVLLGGVIGAIADQQTGAAYKYDGVVAVTMSPAAAPLQGPPQS